ISYIYLRILLYFFFFSSRRRHTRFSRDWSSDVCSSDLFDKALEITREYLESLPSDDPTTPALQLSMAQIHLFMGENDTAIGMLEIGRASCRERGWIWVDMVAVKEECIERSENRSNTL